MPYVNVKTAGSLTVDQRRKIAKRISDAMVEIAGKSPKSTYITFEEIPRDSWAVGDELLSDK